jgi:hypothetical protein
MNKTITPQCQIELRRAVAQLMEVPMGTGHLISPVKMGALILNLHRLVGKFSDDFPVENRFKHLKFTGDLPLPGLMTEG